MRKIDTDDNRFHEVKTGDPTPATRPSTGWINGVRNELCNAIDNLGVQKEDRPSVDGTADKELREALNHFFNQRPPCFSLKIPHRFEGAIEFPFDTEKGDYFYRLLGVCEQFTKPKSSIGAFELILFKDIDGNKWLPAIQRDFCSNQKCPILFECQADGKLLLSVNQDWGNAEGKVSLIVDKRERVTL